MSEKACKNCHLIVSADESECQNCKSSAFSTDWSGIIIVMNPEKSEIAKKLGIKKAGRYAIKVR